MNGKKERKSRAVASAMMDLGDYITKFRKTERAWYRRLARKIFPAIMARRDSKAREEFVDTFRKCNKDIAHASRSVV